MACLRASHKLEPAGELEGYSKALGVQGHSDSYGKAYGRLASLPRWGLWMEGDHTGMPGVEGVHLALVGNSELTTGGNYEHFVADSLKHFVADNSGQIMVNS
jgi:hypothetical protein